jgi:hypothetical protein
MDDRSAALQNAACATPASQPKLIPRLSEALRLPLQPEDLESLHSFIESSATFPFTGCAIRERWG